MINQKEKKDYATMLMLFFEAECKIYDDVKRHKISKKEKEELLKELERQKEEYVFNNNPYKIKGASPELQETIDYFQRRK